MGATVAATAVDERAVEAAFVDDDPDVPFAHDHGVVARDGDVVEEDRGVRVPADRDALSAENVGLPRPAAAAADDQAALVRTRSERRRVAVLLAGHVAERGRRLGLVRKEAGSAADTEAGAL